MRKTLAILLSATWIFSACIPLSAQALGSGYARGMGNSIFTKYTLGIPDDLQATLNAAILGPNPRNQRKLVTKRGIKIAVTKEGIYRITRSEMEAAVLM